MQEKYSTLQKDTGHPEELSAVEAISPISP